MTFSEWQVWCPHAFDRYNNRNHHEGIAYFTPSQGYRVVNLQIRRVRQCALDQFWKQHPERFVRGRPRAPSLPDQVLINQPESREQTPSKPNSHFYESKCLKGIDTFRFKESNTVLKSILQSKVADLNVVIFESSQLVDDYLKVAKE